MPSLFGTRVHIGLIVALIAAFILHVGVTYTRWGIALKVLAGNRKVGAMVGTSLSRNTLIVMALGGALAGFAGICETSAIQGRLQAGLSVGYGLTGFLVAWLSGQNFLRAVPIAILIGGLSRPAMHSALLQNSERAAPPPARPAVRSPPWRERPGGRRRSAPWMIA